MSTGSNLSKIQIRAQVLSEVLKFKNVAVPQDNDIEACINTLNSIEDKEFVCNILIKEISGEVSLYNNLLALIILNTIDPELLLKVVFDQLSDKSVSDNKKLFLINILREQGQQIDFNFIQSCIENPYELVDTETKKFLEDAKMSPETQIDFFDFYFTVNQKDKEMLVDSIIEDYSGDELANILSPFLYFLPQVHVSEKILNALGDTKSYMALEPLEWYIKNTQDTLLAACAKKALNRLKLQGFRKTPAAYELYKPMLDGSEPLGFYYSLADGNSNISCVFARKKKNSSVQTFFTVFNLTRGAVSCFGFDEISKEDFREVLARFFKSSLMVKLPLAEGKRLLDELSERSWQNKNNTVPYEFVCWRRITCDIRPHDKLMECDIKKINVNEKSIYAILNSDIFRNWFYDYDGLKEFASIADKIQNDKIKDIAAIDTLIENCALFLIETEEFKDAFIQKLKLQAYLLCKADMRSCACVLYSLCFDEALMTIFLELIIKKSLYEYFLSRCSETSRQDNVFLRKSENKNCEFASEIVKIIEEQWIQKAE